MKSYFKVFVLGLKYIRKWIEEEDSTHIYAAVLFAFFLFLIPAQFIEENDLNQRTAFALGIITKIKQERRGPRIIYEFYVGDETYIGTEGIRSLSKIRVGDSVYVAYEYTNPHNNEIECYYEYRLDRSKLPDTVFYRQPIDVQRQPLK